MRRKLLVSVYFFLLGLLGVSFVLPGKVVVEPSRVDLPADGLTQVAIHLQIQLPWLRRVFFPNPKVDIQIAQGIEFVQVFPVRNRQLLNRGTSVFIQSRTAEGEAVIRFLVHNASPGELHVFTHTVNMDTDGDGFPDTFRLTLLAITKT